LAKLLLTIWKFSEMVYTDGRHLMADTLDELFSYAKKQGLNSDWVHAMGKNLHPHFDICGHVRKRILADCNVVKVSCKELVKLCNLNYTLPKTDAEVKEWETHNKMKFSDLPLPSQDDFSRMLDNIFKRSGVSRK
jgi:hypothetical protein